MFKFQVPNSNGVGFGDDTDTHTYFNSFISIYNVLHKKYIGNYMCNDDFQYYSARHGIHENINIIISGINRKTTQYLSI